MDDHHPQYMKASTINHPSFTSYIHVTIPIFLMVENQKKMLAKIPMNSSTLQGHAISHSNLPSDAGIQRANSMNSSPQRKNRYDDSMEMMEDPELQGDTIDQLEFP